MFKSLAGFTWDEKLPSHSVGTKLSWVLVPTPELPILSLVNSISMKKRLPYGKVLSPQNKKGELKFPGGPAVRHFDGCGLGFLDPLAGDKEKDHPRGRLSPRPHPQPHSASPGRPRSPAHSQPASGFHLLVERFQLLISFKGL